MSSRFCNDIRQNRSHVTGFGPHKFKARAAAVLTTAAMLVSIVTGCSSVTEEIPGVGMRLMIL